MDTIKVGPIVFDIELVERLLTVGTSEKIDGRVRYNQTTISIESGANSQMTRQILLHEVMHIILTQAGINLGKEEERVCDVIAYGIMALLQDNPWIGDTNT